MKNYAVKKAFTIAYSLLFLCIFIVGIYRSDNLNAAFQNIWEILEESKTPIKREYLIELILLISPIVLLTICSILRAIINRGWNWLWCVVSIGYIYLFTPYSWFNNINEQMKIFPFFFEFVPFVYLMSLFVIRANFSDKGGSGNYDDGVGGFLNMADEWRSKH